MGLNKRGNQADTTIKLQKNKSAPSENNSVHYQNIIFLSRHVSLTCHENTMGPKSFLNSICINATKGKRKKICIFQNSDLWTTSKVSNKFNHVFDHVFIYIKPWFFRNCSSSWGVWLCFSAKLKFSFSGNLSLTIQF